MKKIITILIILLICGCTQKLKIEDVEGYTYITNNKDKVDKFIVETDTLLGKHCYVVNKEEALKAFEGLKIKKETKEYLTDSDTYYKIYFENGNIKTFKFNGENLVYNGKNYELDNKKSFVLSKEIQIDCSNGKINHNLIKTNINNEYNLYYYEIDNAIYKNNDKEVELKDALVNNDITIEDFVSKLKEDVVYYDGGTRVYKNNDVFVEDLELVKCKTLDGNKDVYVGPSGMDYRHNFCMNDNHTFTRTYTVKSIEDYKEQQYEDNISVSYSKSLRVLLKDNNKEEYAILNNFWDNIEVNKTYEFELMLHDGAKIDDSIESIFKNSTIVGVKETDKIGSEQINDLIY